MTSSSPVPDLQFLYSVFCSGRILAHDIDVFSVCARGNMIIDDSVLHIFFDCLFVWRSFYDYVLYDMSVRIQDEEPFEIPVKGNKTSMIVIKDAVFYVFEDWLFLVIGLIPVWVGG